MKHQPDSGALGRGSMSEGLEGLRGSVRLVPETLSKASNDEWADVTLQVPDPSEPLVDPYMGVQGGRWEQPPSEKMLEAAQVYCHVLTQRAAANFYHAMRYLPDPKRQALTAIYAFCRRADDIADGDHQETFSGWSDEAFSDFDQYRTGLVERGDYDTLVDGEAGLQRLRQLYGLRMKMSSCFDDEIWLTDPVFMALKAAKQSYDFDRCDLDAVIDGMEDDLYVMHYRTAEQLETYCARVASATGLLCIDVYQPFDRAAARKHGYSLGQYMQMINILRDVKEDALLGRVYLPQNLLNEYGIDPESFAKGGPPSEDWHPFVNEWARRCNEELEKAQPLFQELPRDSRYSPAVMVALYRRILRRILRRPSDIFAKRVRVPTFQKVVIALVTALRIRLQPARPRRSAI